MPDELMEHFEGEINFLSGSESQSPSNWFAFSELIYSTCLYVAVVAIQDKDLGGERICERRQRNRDAARKSRKKQTERADQLHE
ncbi:hypothetical protein P4O66_008470, partial [Electrophorus voltai]